MLNTVARYDFNVHIYVVVKMITILECNTLFSGGLQQPGSSEWRVAEKNRQRGNDRLLHNTSEMESTMWRQPVEGNYRRLQYKPWESANLF